jgi:hypothetical protein
MSLPITDPGDFGHDDDISGEYFVLKRFKVVVFRWRIFCAISSNVFPHSYISVVKYEEMNNLDFNGIYPLVHMMLDEHTLMLHVICNSYGNYLFRCNHWQHKRKLWLAEGCV